MTCLRIILLCSVIAITHVIPARVTWQDIVNVHMTLCSYVEQTGDLRETIRNTYRCVSFREKYITINMIFDADTQLKNVQRSFSSIGFSTFDAPYTRSMGVYLFLS